MIESIWNNGGPLSLKNMLCPIFVSSYHVDNGHRMYRVGYVFGIRIFKINRN